MRTIDAQTGLRLSSALRARLERGGEISATARALMILGLAACGEGVEPFRAEAQQALAGLRDPVIAQALVALLYAGSTPVEPGFNTSSPRVRYRLNITPAPDTADTSATEPAASAASVFEDPLAALGIEV